MHDSTCRWPECERPAKTKGFCSRDYERGRRECNLEDPWTTWAPIKIKYDECRWPECSVSKIKARGLCRDHYRRAGLVGDMEEPWKLWKPGGHCIVCGTWRDGAIRNQRFCSSACNVLDWKRRNPERSRELDREHTRRRRAQKMATQVERFTDKDIRMAHGDVCYLCGDRINFRLKFPHPKSRSVDHIIPLSRGGSHTLGNVAMTHYQCNQIKNAKAVDRMPQPTLFAL